jgi:hypothetical protein
MKNKLILTSVLSAFVLTGVVNAQPGVVGSATMGVTATLTGSINLILSTATGGMTVTGTGTSTASLPFGTVQMFGGTVPTGVTKTINGGNVSFTLSTPFNVEADLANTTSDSFSLSVTLSAQDAVNAWTLGGVDISSGTLTLVSATNAYGTGDPFTFTLTIPAGEAPNTITNTINLTATSN